MGSDINDTASTSPQPTTQETGRELTFGEKAVGLTFNPGGNPAVTEIKRAYAAIIDRLNDLRGDQRNETARLLSVAITEAQGAQMWAVKAITWNNN